MMMKPLMRVDQLKVEFFHSCAKTMKNEQILIEYSENIDFATLPNRITVWFSYGVVWLRCGCGTVRHNRVGLRYGTVRFQYDTVRLR